MACLDYFGRRKPHICWGLSLLLSTVLPLSVQAGCSRDDVDHYLEKGFTPNQITAICSMVPVAAPQETGAPAAIVSQSPQASQPVQTYTAPPPAGGNFLIDAINGYDTVLTADTLAYTMKQCYDIGDEDLFGFSPEVCPEVRYTLFLKGLKIVDATKKYVLFGPAEIILKGQVNREIISDLGDLKPEEKEILHKKLDTGDEVALPVQQGTPMDRVKVELQKILY